VLFVCTFAPMENEIQNIISKTRSLYFKYGIKSVSMDDVSRELGISKKTLYQHVTDKAELVMKVVEQEINEQIIRFQEIYQEDKNAIDELFEVNLRLNEIHEMYNHRMRFELKKYYPEVYNKIKQVRRKCMTEMVIQNIDKGKKQGLFRNEVNSPIIAMLQMARTEFLSQTDILSEGDAFDPITFNEIFDYHMHGICSPKGLAYFLKQKEKSKKK
jgi:TetR/AcrR family transcriptional regulator, cholesterol catabolism regulator